MKLFLDTVLSFIIGVIPLLNATGAGSGIQMVIETAVFGEMIVATNLESGGGADVVPYGADFAGAGKGKANPTWNVEYLIKTDHVPMASSSSKGAK